jgi:pantoate--beta-alanine ligase
MAKRPTIARTVSALRRAMEPYRKAGERIALVPTMGALHRGHMALVSEARRRARRVVVSIFVNPTQFAPHEDFGSYPRRFAADIAALAEAKVDLVWAPSVAVMYPEGFATRLAPEGAAKADLEDKFRPHFFGGVATVVAKLFTQTAPDFALFGQKDYQQLRVVTQMAKDLDLPLKVVGVPTVRENQKRRADPARARSWPH